jgi:hypothetical protein
LKLTKETIKKKKKNSTSPSKAKEFPALVTDGANSIPVHAGSKELTSNNASSSLGSLVKEFCKLPYAEKKRSETSKKDLENEVSKKSPCHSANCGGQDRLTPENRKMPLEEFKIDFYTQRKNFLYGAIKHPGFIIPPTRSHKRSILELFQQNTSIYKELLRYAAIQFVVRYGSGGIVGKLFNYPEWGAVQFRTYLELGEREEDSFFLCEGYFGKKKPKQYLLLALCGELTLIENETEKSTRFGDIDSGKIDQLKNNQNEIAEKGVPAWLTGIIPKFLDATYHKKRK